jgi:serine/threonine protein kinase/CheY-like chemotaxis protein
VETADDGLHALAAVQARNYDLVLLDIMMPGMNGLEVLERLRARYSPTELPIIMASAETESALVVSALELGANDYITKPLDFPVALARMQSQLTAAKRAAATAPPLSKPLPSQGDEFEPGAVFDDRYRIDSIIGEGGFAVVYRGQQLSTGQSVALKVLRIGRMVDPDRVAVERGRFELEMRLIGELNHPCVVRLLDSGTLISTRDVQQFVARDSELETVETSALPETLERERIEIPYIVMEMLEGETLSALLARNGRLTLNNAVDLLIPVISGVGAAHIHGAIHRDLKPANIFLSTSGGTLQPKVLDFGIAKHTDSARMNLTADSTLIGTPEYMAPEQARANEVDHRCDQYTLASVLYESVTGSRPYVSNAFIALVRQVAEGDFPKVRAAMPDLPLLLEQVLDRATQLEASDRYPTVEDFGLALLPFATEAIRAQWELPLQRAAERTERDSRELAPDGEDIMVARTLVLATGAGKGSDT